MSEKLYTTNITEWREAYIKGTPIQLPSGRVVNLRPVSMVSFLTSDKATIPNTLVGLVNELMTTGAVEDERKYIDKFDITEQKEYYQFIDQMVMSLIVSPKVVTEEIPKGEDEVSIHWFEESDKQWIIQFFNMPAMALEPFRYPENTYVGIMDAMQGLHDTAQQSNGNKTVGEEDTGASSSEDQ